MTGQTISHYKILEKLGGGGMGVVFKAEDTRLKRFVGLKFLPVDLIRDEEAKERFVQEAQAASALDHPNICTIHEIDEVQDGQLFIAMAYYEGETLREKVARNQLSADSAIEIAIQIAQGLSKAHQNGIVHRDIKPANVIVTSEGVVKIIDFGLAKLIGSKGITKTPSTIGTVAYMSPEQVQGERVDHRSDIWSLGVVLYEMLAGQLPFKGEYDQAVIYSILNEDAPPVTTLRPELPTALAHIVKSALRKDRDERFQSIDELEDELRLFKGDPDSKKIFLRARFMKKVFGKKSRVLVLAGTLLLAALLAIFGYFFSSRLYEANAERIPIAVVDVMNETKEEELDGLSGMLITALEQSRRLSVLTRSRMFDVLKQMGKENVERIDEMLGKEICHRANVKTLVTSSIRKFGKVYSFDLKVIDLEKNRHLFATNETGEGQESIPAMIDKLSRKTRAGFKERATEIHATSRNVAEVTTVNLEAYRHYFLGEQLINKLQFAGAQKEFKKAIALDSTFGLAYYQLAYATAWWLGGEHRGGKLIQKAMAFLDRIPEKERFLVRAESVRLGTGDGEAYAEALPILKEMESFYPDDKEMLFRIGDYSYHLGDHATAIEYLERVLVMDPTFARAHEHLIWSYSEMKSLGSALLSAQRYVSAVGLPEAYRLLAKAYLQLGEVAPGLKTLKQAHTLFPKNDEIIGGEADFHIYLEEYDNAEVELKRLLAKCQSCDQQQLYYSKLAQFYPYVGRYREGLRYFEKQIECFAQTHDTSGTVDIQIFKAYYFFWGWNDTSRARMELKSIMPVLNKLLHVLRQNIPVLYTYLGDYAEAERLASKEINISWWRYAFLYSLIYSAKRECMKAEPLADSLLKSGPEVIKIWMLYPLAECQFTAGHSDEAINSLRQLQTIYLNEGGFRAVYYPKSFYLLGKIYEKSGNKKQAIQSYEKLLQLWKNADADLPELIDAKARLERLRGALGEG